MKTLNDVINAVQHETQLSRSQLSLKIGKSRNYLNTTVKNGLSYEKEQELINLLLELVDDEVEMLRGENARISKQLDQREFFIKEQHKRIESGREQINAKFKEIDELNKTIATKNLFIDGLDMENKGLMDRISKLENDLKHMERVNDENHKLRSKLQGQIDCKNAVSEANEELSSKISDLEKDISVTLDSEKSLQKTIESLEKAGHATGKQLNKEITKNRILTASIIGLVAIFSVYAFLR